MQLDLALRPEKLTFYKWTGTNEAEIQQYLADLSSQPSQGIASFVVNEDGTATASCPSGTYQVYVGDYLNAITWQWGGPIIRVVGSADINEKYYPYPEYPPVP